MKIGIISDTHIPSRAKALPRAVFEIFKDAGHIIHAGDIISLEVIGQLERIAPTTAVSGNIDPPEVAAVLGEKKIVTLDGFVFGVFHGHGKKGKTMERAAERFENDAVDCVVFGHSHYPYAGYKEGVLFFNPGSPTDKKRNEYYSVGIIETGKVLTPKIVYFNKKGYIMN